MSLILKRKNNSNNILIILSIYFLSLLNQSLSAFIPSSLISLSKYSSYLDSDESLLVKIRNEFSNQFQQMPLYSNFSDTDCIRSTNEMYFSKNIKDNIYLKKLLFDSSRNKNDLVSYIDCYNKTYNNRTINPSKDMIYLMMLQDNNTYVEINKLSFHGHYFFMGLCVPVNLYNKCKQKKISQNADDMTYIINYFMGRNSSSTDLISFTEINFKNQKYFHTVPDRYDKKGKEEKVFIGIGIIISFLIIIEIIFTILNLHSRIFKCLFHDISSNYKFTDIYGNTKDSSEPLHPDLLNTSLKDYDDDNDEMSNENNNQNNNNNHPDPAKNKNSPKEDLFSEDDSTNNNIKNSGGESQDIPNDTNQKHKSQSNNTNTNNDLNSLENDYDSGTTMKIIKKVSRANKQVYLQLFNSLKLSKLLEDLFTYNSEDEFNKDSGLTNIKGLKGMSMIFMIFGETFYFYVNFPLTVSGEQPTAHFIKNILYIIFFMGIRYAPRVLLSCSGYTLSYKFLCYLDDCYDTRIEEKVAKAYQSANEDGGKNNSHNKNKKKNNNKKNKKVYTDLDDDDSDSDNEEDENSNNSDDEKEEQQKILEEATKQKQDNEIAKYIPKKRKSSDIKKIFFFKFIGYQLYKYLLFLVILLYVRCSLYKVTCIIKKKNGPMWELFRTQIKKKRGFYTPPIISSIFCVHSLLIFPIKLVNKFVNGWGVKNLKVINNPFFLNRFWLFYCEVLFFIVTSILLFVQYKYKSQSHRFIWVLAIIFLCAKVIYFIVDISQYYKKDKDHPENYSLMNQNSYFYWENFSNVLISPLYNYEYYLVGVFFGYINYCMQKTVDFKEMLDQEKDFLRSAIRALKWFKSKSKNYFSISVLITNFACLFLYLGYCLAINLVSKGGNINKIDKIRNNVAFNIFLILDIDVVVVLVMFFAFAFYYKGENFFNSINSSSFWTTLDKCYISFILILHCVIFYVFSDSESTITLGVVNCVIYSIGIGVITIILSFLSYIFIELPWKKINKTIIKFDKKQNEEENDDINIDITKDLVFNY